MKNGSPAIGRVAIIAALGIGGLTAWLLLAQREEVKRMQVERAALAKDNEALRAELSRRAPPEGAAAAGRGRPADAGGIRAPAGAGTPPASGVDAAAPVATNEASASTGSSAASATPLVPSPVGAVPPPRADGLALAGVHAAPDGTGMRATMSFTPTSSDPLGQVAVVVRLPRDAESRILDFAPVEGEGIGNVVKRVADDGKFAVFQGTASDLKKL